MESHYLALARNNQWSNHRLNSACDLLSEEEYFAHRPSFFGSIHATLNHILIVYLVYLGRLASEERVPPNCVELYPELQPLRMRQKEVDRELIEFCEKQDASSLVSSISFSLSSGQKYTETVSRVLSHLFIHQVHHRGQVHGLLSQTSVEPPQLDEFFFEGDLPLRAKELSDLSLPEV